MKPFKYSIDQLNEIEKQITGAPHNLFGKKIGRTDTLFILKLWRKTPKKGGKLINI